MKKAVILLASFVVITSCCRNGEKVDSLNALDILVEKTIDFSLDALERAVEEIKDTSRYPTYATRDDLKWRTSSSRNWVSGFWPGCLWYASVLERDSRFEEMGQKLDRGNRKREA